jgi:DNA-directed RNA polymerase specialized sigma subunit
MSRGPIFMSDYVSKDVQLWQAWKSDKSDQNLEKLIKQVNPIIQTQVNKLSTNNIPRSALEAHALNLAINSFDNYDPNKTQLNTYLTWQLKPLNRYVYKHQNIGKIPESRIVYIGAINRAKVELNEKLGRQPTVEEIADQTSIPISDVKLIEKENRSDLSAGFGAEDFHRNYTTYEDTLWLLWGELDGRDREILEYLYGMNGKETLGPSEIASKLSFSPSRISQLKTRIADKLLKYRLESGRFY